MNRKGRPHDREQLEADKGTKRENLVLRCKLERNEEADVQKAKYVRAGKERPKGWGEGKRVFRKLGYPESWSQAESHKPFFGLMRTVKNKTKKNKREREREQCGRRWRGALLKLPPSFSHVETLRAASGLSACLRARRSCGDFVGIYFQLQG